MKLRRSITAWAPPIVTIADAVDGELAPSLTNDFDYHHPVSQFIGKLVEALHANGALKDEQILELLGSGWQKSDSAT